MSPLTIEQAISLPKDHPARFVTIYGSHPGQLIPPAALKRWRREAEYLAWRFRHPFAADLMACEETNS